MSASRGARQSLFIGRRAPLVEDGQPLLYPRYNKVSEILLSNAANGTAASALAQPRQAVKAAPATANSPAATGTPSKRPTAQEVLLARYAATRTAGRNPAAAAPEAAGAQAAAVVAPATEAADLAPKPKREKKKKKRATEDDAAATGGDASASEQKAKKQKNLKNNVAAQPDGSKQASGPSNADEAATMRSTLGVVAEPAADAAATQPLSFGFGFSVVSTAAEPATPPEPTGNAAVAQQQEVEAEPSAVAPTPSRPQVSSAVPATPGQEYVPRRVFVGGMPYSYEEDAIRDYWSYCGAIEKLDVLRFPDTGRFKGMVFITFATEEGYEAALASNSAELDGQTLKVDRCKAPTKRKAEGVQQQQQLPTHTSDAAPKVPGYWVAYVGNISFDADVSEIKDIFASCDVQQVRLHTDKESGRSKGYAHVHFPSEVMLEKAVGLTGTELHGRNLKISYAQAKKQKN